MYATPTFIFEALCLLVYVLKVTTYTVIAWLVSMTHFNSKAVPTNDTDHSCHIKDVELV